MSSDEASSSPKVSSGADEITRWGAAEVARRIAAGHVSAGQVVQACIERIEDVNPQLNAVVVPLFEEARRAAVEADKALADGQPCGPLHGVPVTIKESFYVRGTPATMGLTRLAQQRAEQDGVLVERLRRAGAIVLGKTNVPLMMFSHECENPLYGRTVNPWRADRTAGGSSGGEAAIIAAGGSPLGLGSDLGGSIRVPCHFCGIHGIKPTSQRLPRAGAVANLRGMEAIHFQPGPMARRVEDLALALRVLADNAGQDYQRDVVPATLPDPAQVEVDRLRIGMWTDDDVTTPSPAIRRAVEQAADTLRCLGAEVEAFTPPDVDLAMDLYFGLAGADGGADARRWLRGNRTDRSIRRLVRLARLPNVVRPPLGAILRGAGQRRSAKLLRAARPRSADQFWQLTERSRQYIDDFMQAWDQQQLDAVICPPHALPAIPHGTAIELLLAASYTLLPNLLAIPAGVVAASRVQAGEESDRSVSRDWTDRLVKKAEQGSEGLPVGVQVCARHWREDIVLAVMAALEEAWQDRADYPRTVERNLFG